MSIFKSLENLEISENCFNDIMDIVEEIIDETSAEKIQAVADKRAYDAGHEAAKQFNSGEKTQKGKKANEKLAKFKDLLRKREDRTGEWAANRNKMQDNYNKGWDEAK